MLRAYRALYFQKKIINEIKYERRLVNRRVEQRQEHSITHTEITQR